MCDLKIEVNALSYIKIYVDNNFIRYKFNSVDYEGAKLMNLVLINDNTSWYNLFIINRKDNLFTYENIMCEIDAIGDPNITDPDYEMSIEVGKIHISEPFRDMVFNDKIIEGLQKFGIGKVKKSMKIIYRKQNNTKSARNI